MSDLTFIREAAEVQIAEAYHWYEKKRVGLGDDFLQAIEESITTIEINPQAFQLKYKNIRAIYTKRFPYGIFYFVEKKKIIVFAVFHLSQNPKRWKKT